jgi:hypothetical protein
MSDAWSEHKEVKECSSWKGNKVSYSAVMNILSIFSRVGCDLSLLHVNNLTSMCISLSDALLRN